MNSRILKLFDIWLQCGLSVQPKQLLYAVFPQENHELATAFQYYAQEAYALNVITELAPSNYKFNSSVQNSEYLLNKYQVQQKAKLDCLHKGGMFLVVNHGLSQPSDFPFELEKVIKQYSTEFRRVKSLHPECKTCKTVIPSEYWAKFLFPDSSNPVANLWDVLFSIYHIDTESPVEFWQNEIAKIQKRRFFLNSKQFNKIMIYTNKSHLEMSLPRKHNWTGGCEYNKYGESYMPNFPTQEIFTAPCKYSVNGEVYASRPWVFQGDLVNDWYFRFNKGRVVDYDAATKADIIAEYLTEEAASYVGEIALMSGDTLITSAGMTFYNTLLDENAGAHFALGFAYPCSLQQTPAFTAEDYKHTNINFATKHSDFVFGDKSINAIGFDDHGRYKELLLEGEWQICK